MLTNKARRKNSRQVGVALAVGVLGIALASCSSSPGTNSGGASQAKSGTGSSANAQPDIPIKVVDSTSTTNFMPFYVAQANGYFKDAGLNVSLDQVSGGSTTELAGMVSGQYNVMLGAATDVILGEEKGIISPTSGKFIAELVGANYDIVSTKSIKSFSDIRGKRVAISSANGSDQVFIEALMKHYNIPLNSVSWITAGPISARLVAITKGAVDVAAISTSDRAVSQQSGNILIPGAKSPVSEIGTAIFVNTALDGHTGELKKFVAAMVKATKWMKSNPDGATSVCEKAISATAALCSASDKAMFDKSISDAWTYSSTEAVDEKLLNQSISVVRELNPNLKVDLTAAEMTDTSVAGSTP